MPSIVQFFHPGKEHGYDFCDKNNTLQKNWNDTDHRRKFLINEGSYIENGERHEGKLLFWGEWEPPSSVEKMKQPITCSQYEKYPDYLHTPFLPPFENIKTYQEKGYYQNTDPFIFGDRFKYSICMQDAFPDLQNLEDGSLIIFGSCVNLRFVIDTVFVVKGSKPYFSANDCTINDFGIYLDIVIKMVCVNSGEVNNNKHFLYTGATFGDDDVEGMYSFVPTQKYNGKKEGFSRIIMPDDFYRHEYRKYFSLPDIQPDRIYERKTQGVKITPNVNIDEIRCFWEYIKEVTAEKCVLGFNFKMPESKELIQ